MKIKMGYMAVILIVLVGCHQPTESYIKTIEKLQITSKLAILETQTNDFSQRLDNYIRANSSDQMSGQLNNEQMFNDLNAIKKLFAEIQTDSEKLNPKDEDLMEADGNLKLALVNYEVLINRIELVLKATSDLDQFFYEIQDLNKHLFEEFFSGEPVSEPFKEALSEFVNSNIVTLELMDISYVEALLSDTSIKIEQLEIYISNANLCKDNLMLMTTYNKSDEVILDLIVAICQQIIEMFSYVSDNIELIEWMNEYDSFIDYYEEQNKVINEYIGKWQEAFK